MLAVCAWRAGRREWRSRTRAGGTPPSRAGPSRVSALRSTRACSCAACPWWAGTTATHIARRYRRCRTSISRWTTSCGCRAPATVSSPASPCSAVSPGKGVGLGPAGHRDPRSSSFSVSPSAAPYYSGNPGPESKISPFWVMPPPEVGGASGEVWMGPCVVVVVGGVRRAC